MGIFKKKGVKREETLSELPRLPELPELPKLPDSLENAEKQSPPLEPIEPSAPEPSTPQLPEINIQEMKPPEISPQPKSARNLPSFPSSDIGKNFSQEAIKSAINPFAGRSPPVKEKMTLELSEPEFRKQMAPSIMPPETEPAATQPPPPSLAPSTLSKKIEPVYIRIDKFKSALNSFEEIRGKISEIGKLLRDIREQKRKEEVELREWERELETIKARIEAIDKTIFSKVE